MRPVSSDTTGDDTAQRAAALLLDAFADYNQRFGDITRRAARAFARRDWRHAAIDARARIELYDQCIHETQARLDQLLDDRVRSRALWAAMRQAYAPMLALLPDREFYQTWFSSLSRRRFQTRGVAPELEFVALQRESYSEGSDAAPHHAYLLERDGGLDGCCRRLLEQAALQAPWAERDADARRLSEALQRRLDANGESLPQRIDILRAVFYRDRRAYLVGRMRCGHQRHPLVLALVHGAAGVQLDALLTDRAQISILFGYARSYFHADIDNVGAVVAFLQALLPHKPLEEIYAVLGRAKQGKTERYRRVFRHLMLNPQEQLVRAEGKRGMVMVVFTPRDLPVVFKLIRDRFASPKESSRRQVEEKYRLVFHHDRVGRLVDAQEFRDLRFAQQQFEPSLREELLRECAESVWRDGDDLVIAHCYVEHRLRPLDLYLREASPAAARRALLDYGQAIKDLAGSAIFPGDLLTKNFGISRSGRAVFYDYDELCLLDECHFRNVPALSEEDETRPLDEVLYAASGDVFPELFVRFLGVPASLRRALCEVHGEIFDPAWWRTMQQRLKQEYVDVMPYPATARLR
jgi:isocitrate dehydrogenase kinase/phosphatase